jgi:predicted carbohydrate-binding protein with CBM5 and CBM33 domain
VVNDSWPIFVVSLKGQSVVPATYRCAREAIGETVTRRIVRRTAAAAVAGGVVAVAGLAPALPAFAHGAPVQPISRTAACAPDNDDAGTAACKAARAANGGAFGNFDNLRVPGVDGKDKQTIPDGKLCSGNLPEFKGLDLARDDWPATKLTAGGTLTIQYRATIPHQGSFRVYLTKPGYDPKQPLGWGDLGSKPILTVDNPPLRDGSYRMSVKLPSDRTGRHLVYTVWQTSSTPDTYYSCSDVVLKAAGGGAVAPKSATGKTPPRTPKPLTSHSAQPGAVAAPAQSAAGSAAPAAHEAFVTESGTRDNLGRQMVTTALIVLVGVTAGLGFMRIRRARAAQAIHSGRNSVEP